MIEKEIRGFIPKEEFKNKIQKFTDELGGAKFSKRLSLALADYDNLTLETKIRINNGKAEIVQKVGDFTAIDREEITIPLYKLSSNDLLNLFRTYKNFLKEVQNPMLTLIQHENYVFKNDRIEIKLFRQFGNQEFFAFEVEALVEMENIELNNFCNDNDLLIDVNYNDYQAIQKRNREVNLDLEKMEDSELEKIIMNYIE